MEGLIFLLCFYFLPSGMAVVREHHNTLAIFLLNLFLGWTLIGWVAALVWAATVVQTQEETRFVPNNSHRWSQPASTSEAAVKPELAA
jgi:uncharacterized iron-regulated membrane protein